MMRLQKVTLLMLLLLACVAITRAQRPTAAKVCPHGQPMMTSSNTPLACLTDEDCGDVTYRCVERPRYTISKVCCTGYKKKYRKRPRQKREQLSPRW